MCSVWNHFRSGVILPESGDLSLRNRSLEASVELACTSSSNLQASVVGVSTRFGYMFDLEIDRTRDSLAPSTTVSAEKISNN